MLVVVAAAATTGGADNWGGVVWICPESFPRKKSATWKVFAFSTSGIILVTRILNFSLHKKVCTVNYNGQCAIFESSVYF